jgi:hypothetical protein
VELKKNDENVNVVTLKDMRNQEAAGSTVTLQDQLFIYNLDDHRYCIIQQAPASNFDVSATYEEILGDISIAHSWHIGQYQHLIYQIERNPESLVKEPFVFTPQHIQASIQNKVDLQLWERKLVAFLNKEPGKAEIPPWKFDFEKEKALADQIFADLKVRYVALYCMNYPWTLFRGVFLGPYVKLLELQGDTKKALELKRGYEMSEEALALLSLPFAEGSSEIKAEWLHILESFGQNTEIKTYKRSHSVARRAHLLLARSLNLGNAARDAVKDEYSIILKNRFHGTLCRYFIRDWDIAAEMNEAFKSPFAKDSIRLAERYAKMLERREMSTISKQFKEAWEAIQSLKTVYLRPLDVEVHQQALDEAFRTLYQLDYVREVDAFRKDLDAAYFGALAIEHPNHPQSPIAFKAYLQVLHRVGLENHVKVLHARWLIKKAKDSLVLKWMLSDKSSSTVAAVEEIQGSEGDYSNSVVEGRPVRGQIQLADSTIQVQGLPIRQKAQALIPIHILNLRN